MDNYNNYMRSKLSFIFLQIVSMKLSATVGQVSMADSVGRGQLTACVTPTHATRVSTVR